jgi:hypothetical protein
MLAEGIYFTIAARIIWRYGSLSLILSVRLAKPNLAAARYSRLRVQGDAEVANLTTISHA